MIWRVGGSVRLFRKKRLAGSVAGKLLCDGDLCSIACRAAKEDAADDARPVRLHVEVSAGPPAAAESMTSS